MRIGLLSAIVVASGISYGCSNQVENQIEVVNVSVRELIGEREVLQDMHLEGDCEMVKYNERVGDWNTTTEGYRCNLGNNAIPTEYAFTISNHDQIYYGPKGDTCNDVKISFGELSKNSTFKANGAIVTSKGRQVTIDNTSCKILLNTIGV